MRSFLLSLVLVLGAASATGAAAGVISADFKTAADLPYCCDMAGPRIAEYSGPVHDGVEIDAAAPVSNPSEWSGGVVHVDLDPVTGLLTLASQDELDFQTFVLSIDNIMFDGGERLLGLTHLSGDLVTGIAPQLSFTGDSLRIRYDTDDIFLFTGTSAVFQLDVGSRRGEVPEPASLALFALACAGLAAARRRPARRAIAASK